jgi:GT2 family glycosyltransferase
MTDLTIVIVNYNTRDLTAACLESVYGTVKDISFEIFVVDNASSDGSADLIRSRFPGATLIENSENRGFAAANNQALRIMKGRYALLLNSDTVLTEGAVNRLFSFMEAHPEAAMACGQLLNRDGSKQNSIASFPGLATLLFNMPILEFLFPKRFPSKRHVYSGPIEIDSGIGACLLVRGKAMEQVGLLDERYFFFLEETDWALQMKKAGWRIFHVPGAKIYHFQGQSIGHNIRSRILFYRSRYIYFRKWMGAPGYLLACLLIFIRLLANWLLTLAANVLTLGLARNQRDRLAMYSKLLVWHLRGCPDQH